MHNYYPLILDLTERSCLVVGGGEVATRKAESLMEAGANVTVIAPHVMPGMEDWARSGRITWKQTEFQADEDVHAYDLVVAATNQPDVNMTVYQAVKRTNGWINIVDRPDLCNFIVPSTVHRGKLVISVSTSGASPGLASKIKRKIEKDYGAEYEGYVDFLAEMRQRVLLEVCDAKERREIFRQMLDDEYVYATDEERKRMIEALLDSNMQEGTGRQS
ncbi:precorrin-2 dehydrogenase/sirohydrochlorin ferrochelatase family protein [Brevibacillus sp. SYSU BS000544]|uniref:precorrin-2 dehydrogenase/sirohydrochlorin ferrochelatase family protein n=1 Tax=Brevibacillus sp. SYSU BS000544 TaxID=3416443 RepID=UPI003CE505F8